MSQVFHINIIIKIKFKKFILNFYIFARLVP
jgi:hypothetical protein